jgi:hypothetical protein
MGDKLKLVVSSLDDVPEDVRGRYEADADGKTWRLQVEMDDENNPVPLKRALARARTEKDAAEKALKLYQEEIPDLDEYREVKAKLAKLEAQGKGDSPKAEELETRLAALRAELEAGYAKESKKDKAARKEAEERADAATANLERILLTGEATRAIAGAKGRVKPLLPSVLPHLKAVEVNGERVVRVYKGGEERLNPKTGDPMTADELVAEMKGQDDYAPLFEGSQAQGSGARATSGASGGKVVYLPRDLAKTDPRGYKKQQAELEKQGKEVRLAPLAAAGAPGD